MYLEEKNSLWSFQSFVVVVILGVDFQSVLVVVYLDAVNFWLIFSDCCSVWLHCLVVVDLRGFFSGCVCFLS